VEESRDSSRSQGLQTPTIQEASRSRDYEDCEKDAAREVLEPLQNLKPGSIRRTGEAEQRVQAGNQVKDDRGCRERILLFLCRSTAESK
jgi:hypothetical protein